MQRTYGLTLLGACAAGMLLAGTAFAGAPKSPSAPNRRTAPSRILPVLVTVSDTGVVTRIQPAYPIKRSSSRRAVRATLMRMITAPAHYKGRAVASNVIIELALKRVRRKDGTYSVQLSYLSALPVPSGTWVWVDDASAVTGGALALVRANQVYRYRNRVDRSRIYWNQQVWLPKKQTWGYAQPAGHSSRHAGPIWASGNAGVLAHAAAPEPPAARASRVVLPHAARFVPAMSNPRIPKSH